MTLRYSTAARNHILQHGSLKKAFQNGKILIYSGAQPASADSAPTGTLLCTITRNSGAHTAEVLATGTVTLTGGASGSVDTVTVDGINIMSEGAVAYDTSLTVTAAAVAAAINRSESSPEYTATSSGAVVTISAARGSGAAPNTFAVSATLTTITASYGNMAGGVTALNGLQFDVATAGTITKKVGEVWSGTNVATGTAGWYRFVGAVADSGVADSSETEIREDGAIATSGAQLNMSSTTLTSGATTTIDTWSRSLPSA
ncbi:hypothetical protein [Aromatoleum anaerobium]|uniref:Uncharacterized protein n=1 Tax=Aromatoleum anaerobium TaxID=182180 RepID=A0ABX1PSI8_9RHOO|nr:hypothetical protein [Aromatoleum anaerobium]MCK0507897.1 hypothetical protein [Aromatoleum anaerobium]